MATTGMEFGFLPIFRKGPASKDAGYNNSDALRLGQHFFEFLEDVADSLQRFGERL